MKKLCFLAGLVLFGLVPTLTNARVTDDPNDEVQIGYGTLKRSEIATSVVSVDVEAMLKKNPTTVAGMIQGAAAGVDVSVPDGAPEETASVVIRGIGTVTGNTAPLWVVDGVVTPDVSHLNPKDVESIDILKDAAALTIFPGCSANGAILITTRSGRNCKTHVTASANVGVQTPSSKYDVLNANELAGAIRSVYEAHDLSAGTFKPEWSERYDNVRNSIDWQKELTRTAIKHNYLVSAYGGNKKSTYNVSLGYNRNDGIMLGSGFSRFTAHAAAKSAVTNYLEIGANLDYAHGVSNEGCRTALSEVAALTPTLDFIDCPGGFEESFYTSVNAVNPDGSYGCGTLGTRNYANPVAEALNDRNTTTADFAVTRAYIDAIFYRNEHHSIDLKGVFGYQYRGVNAFSTSGGALYFNAIDGRMSTAMWPGYTGSDFDNSYKYSSLNGTQHKISFDTYLTYRLTYPGHSLSVMLGTTTDDVHGQYTAASGSSPVEIADFANAQCTESAGAGIPALRHIGYFGRINYALFGRYVIGFSFNRTASSNFSAGNRWATFPSVSLAWRVSEENFFQPIKPWFSNLKIRASWGKSGNDYTDNAPVSGGMQYVNDAFSFHHTDLDLVIPATALTPVRHDVNLKWETTGSHDIGIDLGFLDNTLTASFDYYKKRTDDLLGYLNVRPSAGTDPLFSNYGSIVNSGFEFTLAYNREFSNGIGVHASFLGSTHDNKIVSCIAPDSFTPASVDPKYGWDGCLVAREGTPVGAIYGYVTEKDENGEVIPGKFKDLDGDGETNHNDMTVLGSALPKFTYALNIGFSYKNWDLAIYGYGAAGRDILSYPALRLEFLGIDDATPNNILRSAAGHAAGSSILSSGEAFETKVSDIWVKNADYFRLSDVQIGYNFGDKVLKALKMSGMRLYLAVRNVALASPYKTFGDPENFNGNAALNSIDLGGYARPRTYMAGLNITF